jgi:mono/diheme cytochrome c family protein
MEFYMKKLIVSMAILTATNLTADVKAGQKVYKENCAICHSINGGFGGMGPDFNMVSYTRRPALIAQYAKDPYSLYDSFGYSANAMPTLPLEDKEFKDVADYISSLQPFKKWMIKKKPSKKVAIHDTVLSIE